MLAVVGEGGEAMLAVVGEGGEEMVVVVKVVVVVEMRLVQNNECKRIILPQRSQPGYTNNSLSTSLEKSNLNTHLSI